MKRPQFSLQLLLLVVALLALLAGAARGIVNGTLNPDYWLLSAGFWMVVFAPLIVAIWAIDKWLKNH